MSSTLAIAQARTALDDPHACTDAADVLTVFGALFDTLVRRDEDGAFSPGLAEGWSVSDDARRFTFAIRPGVRFHNGEPCDAAAVRFTLERMARPDMGATLGAPGVYAQYLAGLAVKTPDPLTVEVTLREPTADLFDILAYGHVVSPRAVEAAGDDLVRRAVGTGPYILERYVPGELIEARANPDHFDGPPSHARIAWRQVEEAHERLAALRAGSVQVANGLGREALGKTSGFTAVDCLAPTALIFMFNAARGPAADPRVRLALNLALDREALVTEVLGGAGQPLHGFISPAHVGADPDAPPFRRDLDAARRLLGEAGHAEGLTLRLYCPTRLPDEAQALAAEVEAQLAPLHVRFDIDLELDRTLYANQVRLKQIHDLCVFDSSPMSAFRVLHEKIDARVKGSWWQGYHHPEVEEIIDAARRTVDPHARAALYRRCYRLLQEDPPWLYLYNHRRVVGLRDAPPGWRMRRDGVIDVRQIPPGMGAGPSGRPSRAN